jgi:uncharacterized damage-inducible protein DinB
MKLVENLIGQFSRHFEKDCWAGPSVLEVLDGVTAETARANPVPTMHSIWGLTLHMATWMDVGRWRIEHNEHVPTDAENFPPVTDTSDAAWEAAKQTLKTSYEKLVKTLAGMSEEQLEEQIPAGGGLTHLDRLHGVIQHNMYHAGQIALLKKLQNK